MIDPPNLSLLWTFNYLVASTIRYWIRTNWTASLAAWRTRKAKFDCRYENLNNIFQGAQGESFRINILKYFSYDEAQVMHWIFSCSQTVLLTALKLKTILWIWYSTIQYIKSCFSNRTVFRKPWPVFTKPCFWSHVSAAFHCYSAVY